MQNQQKQQQGFELYEVQSYADQPIDTVNSIVWINQNTFFVSTWASEIIGYQFIENKINRVYMFRHSTNSFILAMDAVIINNRINIFYSTDSKEVFQLIISNDQNTNNQPTLYLKADFIVLFLKMTSKGLISVDMVENIRVNKQIINAEYTNIHSLYEPYRKILSEFCGSNKTSPIKDSLIGCCIDFPYLLLYGMSEYFHFIDLDKEKFARRQSPFLTSFVKCGAIKREQNSLLNGAIVLGSNDGYTNKIKFNIQADGAIKFDIDPKNNTISHFTKKGINLLPEYADGQGSNQNKYNKNNLPETNNIYCFSVNAVDILRLSTIEQVNYVSCGGEGRIIVRRHRNNQAIQPYPFQSISALRLSPCSQLLVYAIGYDWHQGMKAQSYSPLIGVMKLDPN